jgi:hypothetical protein
MSTRVFVELELHGSADQAVGFIEGFRAATEHSGPVWYSSRENIDLESLFETLREAIHRDCHVILPREIAEGIAAAVNANELVELDFASMHEIDYAELAFDFRCFARDHGESVRKVLQDDLPEGVRLEGYSEHEDINGDAQGVELYTPVHHYTISGRGRYVGRVEGIFELDRRLADQDFIHPKKIRLHHPS